MKLVAFSDPHRRLAAAHALVAASEGADVAIGGGDFGDRGKGALEVLDVLVRVRCPLLIVSGNHDRLTTLAAFADEHDHVQLLHGSAVTIDGVRFVGIGSAIADAQPSPSSEWLHERDAAALLEPHRHCDVLISHTPPLGAADTHPDGNAGGSIAVRDALLRLSPVLCLCGHVHRSHGVQVTLGRTRVHNVGPRVAVHHVDEPEARPPVRRRRAPAG